MKGFFLKKKSDQVDEFINFFKDIKAKHGKIVKYVRLDNAGENLLLEKHCLDEGLGIQFEYTSPNSSMVLWKELWQTFFREPEPSSMAPNCH